MRRLLLPTLVASLFALSVTLPAADARACGGTFCDRGPPQAPTPPMPVDQTGENILFVMDGQNVEAHVQIQYTGNPERFAWLVPVPTVPAVTVGSQALFTDLVGSTGPVYGTKQVTDSCSGRGLGTSTGGVGCGAGDATEDDSFAVPSSASGGAGKSNTQDGNPNVVSRQQVGAFQVEVLQGGTAEGVAAWLDANDYVVPEKLETYLKSYLEKGYVFVAIKLVAGAGIDEIHPIAFTYPGNEPCVPIRLTAVAAQENMGIRAFFLSSGRYVPKNYKHVVLNDVQIDWTNNAKNYNDVVSKAVDSPLADGHAFVTEYAGPSSVVNQYLGLAASGSFSGQAPASATIYDPSWNVTAAIAKSKPTDVVAIFTSKFSLSCATGKCTASHPMVMPLLRHYLPVPATLTEAQFYGNVSNYKSLIDETAWDPEAFSKDFDERVVQAGKHALQVLSDRPYLTRMFTTISPNEMTEDPEFFERSDLPTVAADASVTFTAQGIDRTATQRYTCDFRQVVTVPSGRDVPLSASNSFGTNAWPALPASVPYAERIEEFPAEGAPIVLRDNAQAIDEAVATRNDSLDWPPKPTFEGSSSSCGIHAPSPGRVYPALFALAAGVGLARRARRKRS